MKITKKTSEAQVMGIVFYVVAVIFLAIAAFQIYQAYTYIAYQSTAYELTFVDSLSVYIQYCSSYFAFAFIAYGIGNLIHRVSFLNNTLADMMSDAAKEQETEEKVSTEE